MYLFLTFFAIGIVKSQAKMNDKMKKKILFVITSHGTKGDTGEKNRILSR